MKISGGVSEHGVPVGNLFDKYGSRNPVVRHIMRGFQSSLQELVDLAAPSSIHEVGCGEGFWVLRWHQQGLDVRGSDFSEAVIELARGNAAAQSAPTSLFRQRSVYQLSPDEDAADLLVCCEVLEHLEAPERALQAMSHLACPHAIFSVPREPLWSVLNLARGKYWSNGGNTPGHLQRWSRRRFVALVSRYFDVDRVLSPLPWTMLLCCPRRDQS